MPLRKTVGDKEYFVASDTVVPSVMTIQTAFALLFPPTFQVGIAELRIYMLAGNASIACVLF
jgi:hypothetical protein